MDDSKKSHSLKQIVADSLSLFSIAWETDPVLTFLYYLTAGIGALIPVAASYIFKLLLDSLQIAQINALSEVSLLIVVYLIARYGLTLTEDIIYEGFNQSYLNYIFRYKLQNEITLRFHKKIAMLDITYFEDADAQNLITKVRDTMQWRLPDFLRFFAYFFRDIVGYAAAFLVLLNFSWWIPIVVTLVTLPRLYLKTKYGAIQWSIWGSGAPQARKLWYFNYLLQEPTAVREIRIFQSSKSLLNRFESIQKYLFELNKKVLDRYVLVSTVPPIIEVTVIIAISYLYLPSVISAVISLGTFSLLMSMLEQLSRKAASASVSMGQLYEDYLYLQHFFDFMKLPTLIKEIDNPVLLDTAKAPKIEFKNVCFHYPNGPEVLKNVSFVINPGDSVAFVGHNGSGKTTIIKLLCRFYDVSSGEILIDDVNIKELSIKNWYSFLGTLFQEFVHYHFTVRENITLGEPGLVDEIRMIEASKKAGAHSFVKNLPHQYDQILGKEFEDGAELSIGQWQKIAIARAFYQEPLVLILDEPTSAIDAIAEDAIFRKLQAEFLEKTLILVSHRFSTVRNVDKIFVVDEGQIKERGIHETLIKENGIYAKMFNIQAKGYK